MSGLTLLLCSRWLLDLSTPQKDLRAIHIYPEDVKEVLSYTTNKVRVWWGGVTGWQRLQWQQLKQRIEDGGYGDDFKPTGQPGGEDSKYP